MQRIGRARLIDPCRITAIDAVNLYLEQLYQRARAEQISWGHYHAMRYKLKRAVDVLGRDMKLESIRKDELQTTVLFFASRPPSLARPFQKSPAGHPISAVTAHEFILAIKALFVWLSDHDQLTWNKPRGFDRIFRMKRRNLQTAEEQERESLVVISGEVKAFTMEELTSLFRVGRFRDRLHILLGLNCGFTNIDLACLRTFEVFLDAERPHIHKRRHKTGVEARWLLWPETVSLLKRLRAQDNPEKLWLLTQCGNPLVETSFECRRDSVDQMWKLLYARTRLTRHLGFRFMRKTGASAIKRLGGLEESEMYLAHQEPGLNKSYANRNWDRMWACLERFRAQLPFLGPAWELDPAECLFTQDGNPDWSEVNPPWVQRATKRNETGMLNVSLNKLKGKYYARVYRNGKTHCKGYFATAEEARRVAAVIRGELNSVLT